MASPQVCEPIEMTSTPAPAGFAGLYERHCDAVFRAAQAAGTGTRLPI